MKIGGSKSSVSDEAELSGLGEERNEEVNESVFDIVKDDILRILRETEDDEVLLKSLKSRVGDYQSSISGVIEGLRKQGLIQLSGDFVRLTGKGRDEAEGVFWKHCVIEDYFRGKRGEEGAHEAADILEHCVSMKVLDRMKKLSEFSGDNLSLPEADPGREYMIIDVAFSGKGLFERIVSMGVFPGEKVRVLNKVPSEILFTVNGKKFALDEEVASGIKVLV